MATEQRIIIVSAGRNFKKYFVDWCIGIVYQSYCNYLCLVVDDCSTDGSSEMILDFKEVPALHMMPILQKERKFGLYNKSIVVLENLHLKDQDIIVWVDLDDYLFTSNSLNIINTIFKDPNIWFSYGSYSTGLNVSRPYNWARSVRKQKWKASHIRACRWFLFKNILKKDLQDKDGNWYKFPEDRIVNYPMLEMAGQHHVYYNKKILYYYRDNNPDCDMFVNNDEVQETLKEILNKQPYELKTYEQLMAHENDWLE